MDNKNLPFPIISSLGNEEMDLFPSLQERFRIVKFGGADRPDERAHQHLKQMIEECEDLYPGIDGWFKRKVSPDIDKGRRSAILIYSGADPVASAVIRKGDEAKLCSMRITPSHQHSWLGHYMMSLVALDLRHEASSIHFTLPESMWIEYASFFQKFGFLNHGESEKQYRLFEKEFACSATYKKVIRQALKELPEVLTQLQLSRENPLPEILMSIKPKFVDWILKGKKTVEIRTEFPTRWKGSRVVFYASDPVQELAGEGVIDEVTVDSPSGIWERYGDSIGCSREEYLGYCGLHLQVSALKFKDILPYRYRIPRSQLQILMDEELRPPVSYARVLKNRGWLTAISLSQVLRTSI